MSEEKSSSLGRRMGLAALMLSVGIFLSRILGFVREVAISTLHGASNATDAYIAAFTLPEMMNYFLAGGTLSITFIPLFSRFVAANDEEGGWRLFSTIATTMGAALLLFTCVGFVAAPELVPLLNKGFTDPEQLDLTIRMTRIVLPAQLAFYFGGLLQAVLFVREVFWTAAVAPLIYNGCIILGGVALSGVMGIEGFSVGVVVGAVLGPLMMPVYAVWREAKEGRLQVRIRPRVNLKDPDFRKFLALTVPLMLGATLVTVDEWLLRYFGSQQGTGTVTWLNQSRKLMMVLFAVIGQAAGQAALPYLTRLFHEGREAEMGEMLSGSLKRVVFLSVIASAGLMVVAQPLVYAIFHHGAFQTQDAAQTGMLLMIFSLSLTAWASQSLVVRGFYAREDTITPMIIGTVVLVVMLPVYAGLASTMGPAGLALSTGVGIGLNVVLTIGVYRWRGFALPLAPVMGSAARALGIAALAGAAGWGVHVAVKGQLNFASFWQAALGVVLIAGAFGIVLLGMAAVLRPPELMVVWEKVRRKLGR